MVRVGRVAARTASASALKLALLQACVSGPSVSLAGGSVLGRRGTAECGRCTGVSGTSRSSSGFLVIIESRVDDS
eukprot:COSAG04_NODE_23953_length_329_cov_1.226087_1_plen_74_part_10